MDCSRCRHSSLPVIQRDDQHPPASRDCCRARIERRHIRRRSSAGVRSRSVDQGFLCARGRQCGKWNRWNSPAVGRSHVQRRRCLRSGRTRFRRWPGQCRHRGHRRSGFRCWVRLAIERRRQHRLAGRCRKLQIDRQRRRSHRRRPWSRPWPGLRLEGRCQGRPAAGWVGGTPVRSGARPGSLSADTGPQTTAAAARANVAAGGALNRTSLPPNGQLDPALSAYQGGQYSQDDIERAKSLSSQFSQDDIDRAKSLSGQFSQDDIDRAKSLSGLSSFVSPGLAQKLAGAAAAFGSPSGLPSSSSPNRFAPRPPVRGNAFKPIFKQ